MQRPATRSLEVELVEDDADLDGADGGAEPARPLLRVPREVALTAVAAVLLAGSGVGVARLGAERALDARLARTAGLTASLETPLRVAWTAAGAGLVAITDEVVVHGDDLGLGAVGTDLRSGTARYTVPGSCQLEPTEGERRESFFGLASGLVVRPDDVLLCVQRGGLGAAGAGQATARLVDPATGEVRHTFTMVAGDTWGVADGDVVAIGLDAERRVVGGRWSLRTGEARWLHQGTEPAPESFEGSGSSFGGQTIGLQLGAWSVHLDLDTGEQTQPTDADRPQDDTRTVETADGRSLTYGPTRSGGVQTTIAPVGSGDPVTVPGLVPPLAVDDGSVPDAVVALDLDGSAEGWGVTLADFPSGERRWTSEVQGGTGEMGVLSGLVLVAEFDRIVALDARTGETRWTSTRAPTSSFGGGGLVTDGRRVLTVEGDGVDRELVARDVRTGERLWGAVPPISDPSLVTLPDGTVLAVGPRELIAMRP